MGVIEANNLTKYYGRVRGVEGLSFSVNEGEIFGFLGPNGAGKTTAIRLMLDFIRPQTGSVSLFGFDAHRDALAIHRCIGYVSSEPFLYPFMRGQELLNWLRTFRARGNDLSLTRLCEILQFNPNHFVKNYSSGNRKKLALVQALMHRPRLLILDEPTNGLDPIVKQNFYAVLRSLKRGGTTIFFSSHDLAEVQKVCDRVAIIKDGRVVAVEEVSTLINRSNLIVEVTFQTVPTEAELAGLMVTERNGQSVKFQVRQGEINAVLARINQYPITNIAITQSTLEDIFLTWYR
ncbi:MAG: ABC transporter ATP-binding protein [Patescibacteria group bacterium]|jgi:ABC-2 type transport system ATP-binding protein